MPLQYRIMSPVNGRRAVPTLQVSNGPLDASAQLAGDPVTLFIHLENSPLAACSSAPCAHDHTKSTLMSVDGKTSAMFAGLL